MYFRGWVQHAAVQVHSQEGRWDTGVFRPISIMPNCRPLIKNPLASKFAEKNSAKFFFGEFTFMKKYAQLLFIEHIRQSLKFDKPSHYHY
jgi:hypothetical protein